MENVVKFPDSRERECLEGQALLAETFMKRGIHAALANKLSAEIAGDYREFVRSLARIDFAFHTTTDREIQLLKDAAQRFGSAASEVWAIQRCELEIRRLGRPGKPAA